MSLCYDFSKWTMITLAVVAVSLTVGLVLMQIAHGITLNDSNVTVDNSRCVKYYRSYNPGYYYGNDSDKQRVVVMKVWKLYSYNDTTDVLCENWREVVKYFLGNGYKIEGEGLDRITLVKNKILRD
jgi:hypothetical protein